MSSSRSSLDRLRDYERRQVHAFTADHAAWQEEEPRRRTKRRRTPVDTVNTMGPQEDVVERRRIRRQHVSVAAGENNGNLSENLFLLMLLAASIYGLYRLTLYLLMQA